MVAFADRRHNFCKVLAIVAVCSIVRCGVVIQSSKTFLLTHCGWSPSLVAGCRQCRQCRLAVHPAVPAAQTRPASTQSQHILSTTTTTTTTIKRCNHQLDGTNCRKVATCYTFQNLATTPPQNLHTETGACQIYVRNRICKTFNYAVAVFMLCIS